MRGLRSPPRASPPRPSPTSREPSTREPFAAFAGSPRPSLGALVILRPFPFATLADPPLATFASATPTAHDRWQPLANPSASALQVVVIERRTPQTARKPSYYEVASHEILSSVRRSVLCSPNPAAARRMRLGSHPTSQESGSRQAQSTLQEAGATARKLRTGQGAS